MSMSKFWLFYDPPPSPESRICIGQYVSAEMCAWAAKERCANVAGVLENYYIFEIADASGETVNGWNANEIASDLPVFVFDDLLAYKGSIWQVRGVDHFGCQVYIQQIVRSGDGRMVNLNLESLKDSRKVKGVK